MLVGEQEQNKTSFLNIKCIMGVYTGLHFGPSWVHLIICDLKFYHMHIETVK